MKARVILCSPAEMPSRQWPERQLLSIGGRLPAQPAEPAASSIQVDPTLLHELSPYLFMQFMEPLGQRTAPSRQHGIIGKTPGVRMWFRLHATWPRRCSGGADVLVPITAGRRPSGRGTSASPCTICCGAGWNRTKSEHLNLWTSAGGLVLNR